MTKRKIVINQKRTIHIYSNKTAERIEQGLFLQFAYHIVI